MLEENAILKVFADSALFSEMSVSEINKIFEKFSLRSYQKGQRIYSEGENVRELLLIVEGKIEITDYDFHGNKRLLAILGAGEIFAESVALSQAAITPFTIQAISSLQVLTISKNQLFLIQNHQFLLNLLQLLANKNVFLTHKLECISKGTIQERVFTMLKYYYFQQQKKKIRLPYNKTQLAEYLCVTRSALSREIRKMESVGYFHEQRNTYELQSPFFQKMC